MLWVVWAVLAHVGNALVFVGDKTLLRSNTAVGSPVVFAAYSGVAAALVGIILPFVFAAPTMAAVGLSLLGGVFWVAALWLFFDGLDHGETSRVVPIAGSAVPVFTAAFALFFVGERLSPAALLAVGLLIAGGALLSISLRGAQGLSGRALLMTVASGAAFAAHFATLDVLYDRFEPFLAGFAYARIGVGVVALGLLAVLWATGRLHRSEESGDRQGAVRRDTGRFVLGWFVGSKIVGAGALALQNYAISLGSVTVVNSLQGVQYLFLLVLAAAVSRWWPKLFVEELARVTVIQKVVGIVVLSIGLALIVIQL